MKTKVKIKNKQLFVHIKLDKEMEVSKRELDIVSTRNMGLLMTHRLKPNLLEYTGPQGVSLIQYLKQPIVKEDFFNLMKQIVDVTRAVECNQLFLKNLILDMRYVFINQMTKELKFIYLPVLSEFRSSDVIGFMEAIVYQANFQKENTDFLVQYMKFLRELGEFSTDKVEEYLLDKCRENKNGTSGFAENLEQGTSVLATALYPDDDGGTTLLTSGMDDFLDDASQVNYVNVHFPFLIRLSNNEKIVVNKDLFVMGKAKNNVDYTVLDNAAISRIHADIVTRGTHFFVVDHNSTNKTYIDDAVLPGETEVELMDGSILRLANEEFEFHI